MTAFSQLLQHPHYRLLGKHAAAELGQRQFHEVELTGVSGSLGGAHRSGRFLWRLGMQAVGCWMMRSIEVL